MKKEKFISITIKRRVFVDVEALFKHQMKNALPMTVCCVVNKISYLFIIVITGIFLHISIH